MGRLSTAIGATVLLGAVLAGCRGQAPAPTVAPILAAAIEHWNGYTYTCHGPFVSGDRQRADCRIDPPPVGEPTLALSITEEAGAIMLVQGTVDRNDAGNVDSPGAGMTSPWKDVVASMLGDNLGSMPGSPEGLLTWVTANPNGGNATIDGATVRFVVGPDRATIEIRR